MELYFIHPDIGWLIRRLFQLHISHYDSIILIVSFNLFPTMISQKAKQIISMLIINGMKLPLPIRVLSGVPKKVIIGVAYLWPAGKGGCMEQTNVSDRPQGIQDVPNQIEDKVLKTAAMFFGHELLPYLGIKGRMAAVAPTEQIHLDVRRMEEDFNFIMEDAAPMSGILKQD